MTPVLEASAPLPHGLPTQRGFLGKVTTEHKYNATSIGADGDGKDVSFELVQIGVDGKIYRSCGMQSYDSGTASFDASRRLARRGRGLTYRIERDGGRAYKRKIVGLMGPEGVERFVRAATGR